MERGEVDGLCGWDWSSVKSQKSDWVRDKKLNVLVQVGLEPQQELTEHGRAARSGSSSRTRTTARSPSWSSASRCSSAPTSLRPERRRSRSSILRTAFDATMKDPQFLADADKMKISITPLSGQQVQDLIAKLYATPSDFVERAKTVIKP